MDIDFERNQHLASLVRDGELNETIRDKKPHGIVAATPKPLNGGKTTMRTDRKAIVVVAVLAIIAGGIGTVQFLNGEHSTLAMAPIAQPPSTTAPNYPPAMGDPKGDTAAPAQPAWTLMPLPAPFSKLGDEPAHNALARLGAEAKAGNAQAAYDAFFIAYYCSDQLKFFEGFAKADANAADPQHRAASQAVYDRAKKVCGPDLTPALLDERFAHIKQAADADLKNAADNYFVAGPRGVDPLVLAEMRNDPSVVAWLNSAIAYLQHDLQKGNVNAAMRLASIYESDNFAAHNPQTALTYHLVAAELHGRREDVTEKTRNWMQASTKQMASEIAKQLPADQQQMAQKQAQQILKTVSKGA